jgi:hypothetical protein
MKVIPTLLASLPYLCLGSPSLLPSPFGEKGEDPYTLCMVAKLGIRSSYATLRWSVGRGKKRILYNRVKKELNLNFLDFAGLLQNHL